jgi:hypothetical protein
MYSQVVHDLLHGHLIQLDQEGLSIRVILQSQGFLDHPAQSQII